MSEEFPDRFRHPIRAWRQRKGVKMQELADKISVTVGTLHHIEVGHRRPSTPVAMKLAEITGVSLVDIVNSPLQWDRK